MHSYIASMDSTPSNVTPGICKICFKAFIWPLRIVVVPNFSDGAEDGSIYAWGDREHGGEISETIQEQLREVGGTCAPGFGEVGRVGRAY